MRWLIRWIIAFLRWLFGLPLPAPGAGTLHLTVIQQENGMLGIKVDVIPPAVRNDAAQTPLDISELRGWQIYTQIDGASTWSPIGGLNAVDVTTRTIGNVPEGTKLRVRTTWFDRQDPSREGVAAEQEITAVIIVPPPVLAEPAAGGMTLTVVPQ